MLDWSVTGKFLVTLLIISAVLLVAVFLAEQSTHWFNRDHAVDTVAMPKESDVQLEFMRVDSGHADSDVLVLKKLTKVRAWVAWAQPVGRNRVSKKRHRKLL